MICSQSTSQIKKRTFLFLSIQRVLDVKNSHIVTTLLFREGYLYKKHKLLDENTFYVDRYYE